ncbi:hypothetical protein HYFRA_00003949 [Hymenoscyphus fraxineus]|uniref:Uncharacterized protein n=1 Tax=Hymenoscyphus fraxineus TaxID=746836 RepID=A0A9N9KY49_9HELO|nr:hypothetical protein HYFRA_00003949 [Hymenoscyphus fraxineus]
MAVSVQEDSKRQHKEPITNKRLPNVRYTAELSVSSLLVSRKPRGTVRSYASRPIVDVKKPYDSSVLQGCTKLYPVSRFGRTIIVKGLKDFWYAPIYAQ